MRVLMLGWEFPPHISGGLGTACEGLTRGLAANGVAVTFVVPRATGDEDQSFVEIVGCDGQTVPWAEPARGAGAPSAPGEPVSPRAQAGAATAPAGSELDGGELAEAQDETRADARFDALFELLAVASPLAPYQTEASYHATRARLEGPAAEAARTVAQRGAVLAALRSLLTGAMPAGGPVAALEDLLDLPGGAGGAGSAGSAETFRFSGRYGEDLLDEVARYALAVLAVARAREFDLVHAHDWMTVPAGALIARARQKPLVLHVHASEYDRSGEHVNPRVRDIEQLGLDLADRIVCVSHFTASLVRRRYRVDRQKLRVVHNAVTQREQARSWHVEKAVPEPIVLFLGRVTFQKGPDYFLEAAARVVSIEPRVKFVMSGSGDMLPRMIEHAARLGLARHVHFTGFLRGKDVERMFAMADIYVMPSVSEPFGISPLEAMALDVPVIVSRQSGVAEVLRNALKVDFWDVEDIANKILALLRYDVLSRQLIEEGKQEVHRLRWERQARLVADIYTELVP